MNFIRFSGDSGELFLHHVLIALGGGVLMGFTAMIFKVIGIRADVFSTVGGAVRGMGAVLIGSWRADAKLGVIGNILQALQALQARLPPGGCRRATQSIRREPEETDREKNGKRILNSPREPRGGWCGS
jgi:hypothetical protein